MRKSGLLKVGVALLAALVVTFPLVAACEATAPADHWTVKVTGGEVRGIVKDGVATFKGIPFAAPPVGELRWKAPQPVKPWDGVRDAYEFAPAPMQPAMLAKVSGGVELSEDCLYLNVWTGAKSPDERRPVMVSIYGGGFTSGATSIPFLDGTALAKKGVVMVSIAYRVGPFGFLAHPELSAESGKGSGCYGIQDQIAGLRWVKKNISHFGGNASRVTIFGGSSGGTSVSILAASPPAKALFQRAICQSGGSMAPINEGADKPGCMIPSLEYAEEQGKKFLAELGVPDIRAARALSAEAVQKGKLDPCWPVADGQTIVRDPYELYEGGKFNDTPVLIGTNSDDGGFFAVPTSTPALFEKFARDNLGLAADEILAAYPHATDAEAARSGRDLVREAIFAWPSWAWASLQSQKGKGKAFLYCFDYGSPKPGDVSHGAETAYVFGTFGAMMMPAACPENVAMSDTIQSYWVNFATNGNPNGPELPEWPPFDSKTMNTMIFGKTPEVGPTPNIEKIKAFDTYYARLREQRRK
jgi:para-nitrobenzyl esterase